MKIIIRRYKNKNNNKLINYKQIKKIKVINYNKLENY